MELTRCDYCGASMTFAGTRDGRAMPLDPEPAPDGNVMRTVDAGGVAHATMMGAGDALFMPEGATRHTPHFANCVPYHDVLAARRVDKARMKAARA